MFHHASLFRKGPSVIYPPCSQRNPILRCVRDAAQGDAICFPCIRNCSIHAKILTRGRFEIMVSLNFLDRPTSSSMKRQFAAALASVWLIFFAAVGLRLAYAWQQQRQIPAEVLLLRFHQETGNIAYSLAMGKGFSSPFGRDTGPTAWVAPVYPLLIAGIFRIFGVETIRSFFAAISMNILFSAATCLPLFYAGKRIAGQERAATPAVAAWFWALLPNAVIFPFEWVWDSFAHRAPGRDASVGHARTGRIAAHTRLVRLRPALGLCTAHQSVARLRAAILARMGRLPRRQARRGLARDRRSRPPSWCCAACRGPSATTAPFTASFLCARIWA